MADSGGGEGGDPGGKGPGGKGPGGKGPGGRGPRSEGARGDGSGSSNVNEAGSGIAGSPGNRGDSSDKVSGNFRKVYGRKGNKRCLICRDFRDHVAANCPGNVCNKCGARGHWVAQCTADLCDWCGKAGHQMVSCTLGGAKYLQGKRKAEEEGDSSEQLAAKSARSSEGISYSQAAKTKPFIHKVSSFLDDMSTGFMSQSEVNARRQSFVDRRKAIEEEYRRALAQVDREEKQLQIELENEQAFRAALDNLAQLKDKVLRGAALAAVPSVEELNNPAQPMARAPVATQVPTNVGASTSTAPAESNPSVEVMAVDEELSAQTPQEPPTHEGDKVKLSHFGEFVKVQSVHQGELSEGDDPLGGSDPELEEGELSTGEGDTESILDSEVEESSKRSK